MKKAVCILNAYKILPGLEHFYLRMKEELAKRDYLLTSIQNSEVLTYLSESGDIICNLDPSTQFVLYLDKDAYISHGLEISGFRLFNSATSIELCDDKMKTYMALEGKGIQIPKTIPGPLTYSQSITSVFVERVASLLSFPLVAKLTYGSMGNSVHLIANKEELYRFEEENRYMLRLYQEWIHEEVGVDYRLLVIGGKCVAAMQRKNTHDFRSNLAQGGIGSAFTPPPSYKEVAEKAAAILHLDYCGVDLLKGKDDKPILCEVNSNAFMQGIEKATGINVASIYADTILETLKKEQCK